MIEYTLGYLTGIVTATLIVATLTFFKKAVVTKVERVERFLESKGPQQRGFIVEPDDEAEEVRQEVIEKNRREGRDTPLSDLM